MKRPPALQAPHWWQLYRWIMQPLTLLEATQQQLGDVFCLSLMRSINITVFSDPKAIEQIFTANPTQFESGRANLILQPTLGDNSLILLDGDRHKRQRQLLMPPFHGERMKAYGDLIRQVTQQVIQWQPGQIIAIRPFMQAISLEIILRAVFGLTDDPRSQKIKHLIGQLLDMTASRFGFVMGIFPILQRDFGPWSPGGRFLRLRQQIDDLIYAEIQARRDRSTSNQSEQTDILSLLMAARDEDGQPMTDVELRDELMTLLIAGHETTATALSWALYWMHLLPEVQSKLRSELEQTDLLDSNAITRLPYLNAVCLETLRLYPVAMITFFRITKAPFQVLDYEFPPDSFLAPCIYLTHHRPDLYPEPKQFKPNRFLERQFSPYEYFPFGGSNRRCIGAAFALFEMKLVLATMLQQYTLALAETRPVRPVRRGVTLAPQGGIRMKIVEQLIPIP